MVQKAKENTAMKIQVVTDIKNVKNVLSTATFSGLTKSLSDADFAELAEGIASLQEHPFTGMTRLDSARIFER